MQVKGQLVSASCFVGWGYEYPPQACAVTVTLGCILGKLISYPRSIVYKLLRWYVVQIGAPELCASLEIS